MGGWRGPCLHQAVPCRHASPTPHQSNSTCELFCPRGKSPPCKICIASSRCLIIRSTHGVDLSSLDVPHPANSATCDPASWTLWPKLDLRLTRTRPYQTPPPSHNRRSCRSRSRTRKSLRGRIDKVLEKIRGHARVLQSRILQVRSPREFSTGILHADGVRCLAASLRGCVSIYYTPMDAVPRYSHLAIAFRDVGKGFLKV